MCKKSLTERNKRRKCLFEQYQNKRKELKKQILNTQDFSEKLKLIQKLDQMKRDSSASRYRNRCFLTGRPRGFVSMFGICRVKLRECLSFIPGIKKASW